MKKISKNRIMKPGNFIIAFIMVFMIINASCYGKSNDISNTKNKQVKSDFEVVGFHLDLRIQVMKPEALKNFAKELASFGINTLVMEWEGTFPYESNPLIPNRYAYTKEEIEDFISYCNNLNIDVIPLQQSFGHLEYVLRFPRYADLREDRKDYSQICPTKYPELDKQLFTELFSEMAALHPSKYFHIGFDEARLIGHCDACKAKVEKEGKSALIADHLNMLCDILDSLGKTPVLWADVALKYPDKLSSLHDKPVFIDWNYGWAIDRFGDTENLIQKGFSVWGSPTLRSGPDNFYLTNWDKHFKNIYDFIPYCREKGYKGIVMTCWSTSGIYSSIFEDHSTISELIPVRNVYPISGFRILIAAYAQSMHQKAPLDIKKFISSYCEERFGLNNQQSLQFWKALKGLPYMIRNDKVSDHPELTVSMLLDTVRYDQKILNKIKPLRNQEEFAHFRLMTDIRENYLSFKKIEAEVNSPDFNEEMLPQALNGLEEILNKDKSIKNRFTKLNRNLLYPGQIEEENQTRIRSVKLLYQRLLKQRK